MRPKTAAASTVRSLIVPGWGQIYKEQPGKGITAFAIAVAAGAGIYYTNRQTSSAVDNYEKAKLAYDHAVAPNQISASYRQMNDKWSEADRWKTTRNSLAIGLGGVWLLNVVDAALGFPLDRDNQKTRVGLYLETESRLGMTVYW